jgi:uncharacterized protein YhhL (DUF1145 family)
MLPLLKALCLGLYALALTGLAGWLPPALSTALQFIAATFLVVHLLEAIFCLEVLRRYPGSLATSVLLTLLFGVLHLGPLVRRSAKPV